MNKKYVIFSSIVVAIISVGLLYFYLYKKDSNIALNSEHSVVTDTEKEKDIIAVKKFTSLENAIDKCNEAINTADYTKAKSVIESAITEYPQSGTLRVLKGTVLGALGEKEKALGAADEAIRVEPTNYLTWRFKIILIRNTFSGKQPGDQEYKKTITDLYTQALLATHNNIELITPYAIFLEQAGDIQAAIQYWTLAITVNPLAKTSYEREIDRLGKIK